MDFDVTTRRTMKGSGVGAIGGVWIREVQSKVVGAVRIARVDAVRTLRRLVIALELLGAGDATERHGVSAQGLSLRIQSQRMFRFRDDQVIGALGNL